MLIKSLSLKRILSFNDATVELGPLNVLIGPNAVGKSNVIEIIGLLQAAPTNILTPILRGGGVSQWVNLGTELVESGAVIECELGDPDAVSYRLHFLETAGSFTIFDESLSSTTETFFKRSYNALSVSPFNDAVTGFLPSPSESFLSQFRDPLDRTPVSRVGRAFSQIRIYREFRTGAQSGARNGTSTQVSNDALADGGDNLAMALHQLDFSGKHDRIRDNLRRFCERFEDVKVNILEGLARPFLSEAGLTQKISALRMSDGTLKFLCLLVVLFNANRSRLICIEEPEIGLHPDAMQIVADVLVEASKDMQIIVTTHSEALIDALSDTPESVLVCDRGSDNGTQMRRLKQAELKDWLAHYSLGRLWRKGEIGGNP